MKKLFLFNSDLSNKYREQLDKAFNLFSCKDKNVYKTNVREFNYSSLKNIDVVISNKLSLEMQAMLNKNKIVSITIDKYIKNCRLVDIYIDYLYEKKINAFTGSIFKIENNKNLNIKFQKIFDLIHLLEWDSEFWGFPVALINSKKLTKNIIYRVNLFIKKNNIKLIQYLCDCHDKTSVDIVEKNNFQFKDIRLTFEKVLIKSYRNTVLHKNFRKARSEEVIALQEIGKSLYLDSRYYFDENFNRDKVKDFYMEWIFKAVHQKFDDDCYVLCKSDKPIAYCTLKYLNKMEVAIGLVGVDKNVAGSGYGKILIKNVIKLLDIKGYNRLIVVSQGRNYRAQRLYQRSGFLTYSTELWYHKWV